MSVSPRCCSRMGTAHHQGIPRRLLTVARAISAGRRLLIHYRDAHGVDIEREVDALALAFRGGPWLLAAWCRRRDAFRLFRVERIARARILPSPSAGARGPNGFDPRFFATVGYLEPGAEHPVLVTLRLRAPLLHLARALFPAALLEHPSPDAVLCHMRATRPADLAELVASLGPGAELVQPAHATAAAGALRPSPP